MRRNIHVHLLPEQIRPQQMVGGIAVVIDVLRASTTIVHALAAGCKAIMPCGEIDEANDLAQRMLVGKALLAGERDGEPIAGFDLGNSPTEYTSERCQGMTILLTTTNGTRALLGTVAAQRTILAGFVNFSAVCEQLLHEQRAVHLVCAGCKGEVALEDTLLAGAFVDVLSETTTVSLNDGAQIAWACFENHGHLLRETLELCQAGMHLRELGFEKDVHTAAMVDRFHLVPQLAQNPLRIEVGSVGIRKCYWPH